MLIPVSIITVVAIVTVMAVTGRVSQMIIRHEEKKKGNKDND